MLARWLSALFFLGLVMPFAAAKPSAPASPFQQPMKITLVRDSTAGCEPDCSDWIAAQGRIGGETPAMLRRVIQSLKGRHVTVVVHSPGGQVEPGIAMGRMIRAAGLDVVVGKAEVIPACSGSAPCPAALRALPDRGSATSYQAVCASSCSFLLAGGVQRSVGPNAYAGVHQVSVTQTFIRRYYLVRRKRIGNRIVEVSRTLLPEKETRRTVKLKKAPKSVNDNIAAYFREMGMEPSLLQLQLATPSEQLHYLDRAELTGTRLATNLGPIDRMLYPPKPLPEAGRTPVQSGLTREEIALMNFRSAAVTPDLPVLAGKPSPRPVPARLAATPTRHFDADIDMGTYDGQPVTASLSFVGQFAMPGEVYPAELLVILRSNGKPVPVGLIAFSIALGPGRAILASNTSAGKADAELVVRLMPDDFCRLSPSATAKLRLGTPESGLTIVTSLVEVPAASGLPMNAVVANFCP